jgi:hypothetical protein
MSLDGPYSRLKEGWKIFWTPQVSGYQMETLGDKENLIGDIRNVQMAL